MQKAMSALPPKADMCSALADVRFVPKADIAPSAQRGQAQSKTRNSQATAHWAYFG